jgi:hypothetical protein
VRQAKAEKFWRVGEILQEQLIALLIAMVTVAVNVHHGKF